MAHGYKGVRLTPLMVPDFHDCKVKESSFFTRWQHLPSPKEVQAQAKAQHLRWSESRSKERLFHQLIFQAATCPVLLKDELHACVADAIAMGYVHLQDRQARSKGYYMEVKKRTSA
ncbi:uncharacterized protein BO96DRAFT_481252 [Aspergillus niger CBS 101883]|uniref:uncharacterized protein n=1 Tax=Aspergillus lacticoffeatus (strain CBS 101883) TaxID=1450533 RepID=UPI000D7F897F|nr:uncharacterized protein BO96DRAFT_481252 [Aspergillus niger CBS 101883]PYH53741.1 hypothetical protein BO96DRAFT_481252 [Aspergillus niger CBS 101883]